MNISYSYNDFYIEFGDQIPGNKCARLFEMTVVGHMPLKLITS